MSNLFFNTIKSFIRVINNRNIDATPTGLRSGGGIAMFYTDAAPTGLRTSKTDR